MAITEIKTRSTSFANRRPAMQSVKLRTCACKN